MKRKVSVIVILAMVFTCFSVLPSGAAYAKTKKYTKDGFYVFVGPYKGVKCKITKKTLTVKKAKGLTLEYDDEYIMDGTDGDKVKSNCKFKLGKTIYAWEADPESYEKEKFGNTIRVSRGKTISRAKFVKNKKKYQRGVCICLVVKNGKIVGWGTSAGSLSAI